MRPHIARVVLCAALLVNSGACRDDAARPGGPARDERVVVASFNFGESRLLGEIYAQALEGADIEVRRELELGPRELVQPALQQGLVDVVPEYLGSAAASLGADPVDPTDAVAVRAALAAALGRWRVQVLAPAPAQNQNAFVVTTSLAERHGLRSVTDLAGLAPGLVIGGPPECPTRPLCLLGLERRYGLRFGSFMALVGEDRVRRGLEDGVIDVGVMFSTDGRLASSELIALVDDQGLQPAENVVPVVRQVVLDRHPRAAEVLDGISSRLTTSALRVLNWRVAIGDRDAAAEARGWLIRQGLIQRQLP